MLADLQQQLNDTYQVGQGHDVRDFLITDPCLAKCIGGDSLLTNTAETLLLSQDEDSLGMSLFLDSELLDRLRSANPIGRLRADQLDDLWKVLEGVSHFVCVAWKAEQDRKVSLLELELQAEIDKFVSTMQLVLDQRDGDMLNHVHGWLFDNVEFNDELDDEQLDRYREANDYAARFCRGLWHRFVDDDRRVLPELREFYRLQLTEKISHINTCAWG